MTQHWYAVYTQVRCENLAEQHLRNQGFETYVPRFKKKVRHARKMVERNLPLFPRYLFVAFDCNRDQWCCIKGTRGVQYLVTGRGRKPIHVPTQIIEQLQQQQDANGLLDLTCLSLFQRGAKVQIIEGAFIGCEAVFQKMTDSQRVELLLTFLNREMRLELSTLSVKLA